MNELAILDMRFHIDHICAAELLDLLLVLSIFLKWWARMNKVWWWFLFLPVSFLLFKMLQTLPNCLTALKFCINRTNMPTWEKSWKVDKNKKRHIAIELSWQWMCVCSVSDLLDNKIKMHNACSMCPLGWHAHSTSNAMSFNISHSILSNMGKTVRSHWAVTWCLTAFSICAIPPFHGDAWINIIVWRIIVWRIIRQLSFWFFAAWRQRQVATTAFFHLPQFLVVVLAPFEVVLVVASIHICPHQCCLCLLWLFSFSIVVTPHDQMRHNWNEMLQEAQNVLLAGASSTLSQLQCRKGLLAHHQMACSESGPSPGGAGHTSCNKTKNANLRLQISRRRKKAMWRNTNQWILHCLWNCQSWWWATPQKLGCQNWWKVFILIFSDHETVINKMQWF